MARINWLDEETNLPALDAQVQRLGHFTRSMADGVIDSEELATQAANVASAMKEVQEELNDDQHARVTNLLLQLTAYNVMTTLAELAASRVRRVAS